MKTILTVGVRSHFDTHDINEMWSSFERQREENPAGDLYSVGQHIDWRTPDRKPHVQSVLVKIDHSEVGRLATMLLEDEY